VQRITDAVSRSAAVRLQAGVSIAPAIAKRPTGGRTSTTLPAPQRSPTSTLDLLEQARNSIG